MEIPLLFSLFFPIFLAPLMILAPFFLIWGGLKVFNIQGISNRKIVVYLIFFTLGFFLVYGFLNLIVGKSLGYFATEIIYRFISLIFDFLLLKYYFHLSGKKLWQLLAYLVITGLIFSVIAFYLLPYFK